MTAQLTPPVALPYQPLVERRRSPYYVTLAKQKTGLAIDVYDYLTPVPWVVEAYIGLMQHRHVPSWLTPHQSELCSLVLSYDHSCRYCHGASRTLLRISGMPEEKIRRLEQDLHGSDLSPREKHLLDLALRVSRGNVRREDVQRLLSTGFDQAALLDLACLSAWSCFGFRLASGLGIGSDEGIVRLQQPWARAVRPLLAEALRRLFASRKPGPLSLPESLDGPFARVLEGYRPIPHAALKLRQAVDAAFASPIVSRGAKGLVFAVVARAMGEEAVEREALDFLASEGMARPDAERAIRHLASPLLSAFENRLLTFARDTVKYVPTDLQDRGRELKADQSDEVLIEALGTCALANTIVRLSLVLQQV